MLDLALDNRLLINNKLDAAIQELDLLFNTECTELLGDTSFGLSLDQFLWTLTPMEDSFRNYVEEKLNGLFYVKFFNYTFDIEFLEGEFRSIYRLKINLYLDQEHKIQKEYEFR